MTHQPHRWSIFGAMCGVYFAFGVILLAIPPMVTEVRTELGASRSEIGFALSAWGLLYIVTAPPAGRIIDRIGLRRSLAAGSLLIAASAAIQATAQSLATMWLAIAIVGVGGPLISLSAPKLITMWFTDARERPLAVGLYSSAPSLGGVCTLVLTNSVLLPALGDWRAVLMAEAVVNVVAATVWIIVSGRMPGGAPPAATDSPASPVRGSMTARALLASPGVRIAMFLGIGTFFINQGLSSWLPDMLDKDSALSPRAASNWAAASLVIGLVARVGLPSLAIPERRSALLHGVMLALAVAMVAMAVGPPPADVAAVLVLGARSALTSLVIVLLMESDGVTADNAGLAYGLWFSAVEAGGAAGPLVVGALGDSGVGFPGALFVMAIMLGAMMVVLTRSDRRQRLVPQPAIPV